MSFWVIQGILLFEFLPCKETLNADHCYTTLWHLKEAIQIKHPDLLTEKVILLHSNAHPDTAGVMTPPLWSTFVGNVLAIHNTAQTLHLATSTFLDSGCKQ
jgi:hypothetical protein